MNRFQKLTLTAILWLATALILSCSTNGSNDDSSSSTLLSSSSGLQTSSSSDGNQSSSSGGQQTSSSSGGNQSSSSSGQQTSSSSETSPSSIYIITGSGNKFSATKNGLTIGMANQSIQDVINAIRTNANGAGVYIQFGDGTTVLDINTDEILLENVSGTWGSINLTGKITSRSDNTIFLYNDVSVNSNADISNTSNEGYALYNAGGTITINGGVISSKEKTIVNFGTGKVIINEGTILTNGSDDYAITLFNNDTGEIIIKGGTVTAGKTAVYNDEGTVTISGGNVTTTADSSFTIRNYTNTVTISDNARVSSTGIRSMSIYNEGRLNVNGGIIEGTGLSGISILNRGVATISAGTVSATGTNSYAVYNDLQNGGTITVTIPPAIITGGTNGIN